MGFSIKVTQRQSTQCPHCSQPVTHTCGGEEVYYAQKHFFTDYFNSKCNQINEMEIALGIKPVDGEHWSMFEGTGDEAFTILEKIKHLVCPDEYRKIHNALKLPNTEMYASW